ADGCGEGRELRSVAPTDRERDRSTCERLAHEPPCEARRTVDQDPRAFAVHTRRLYRKIGEAGRATERRARFKRSVPPRSCRGQHEPLATRLGGELGSRFRLPSDPPRERRPGVHTERPSLPWFVFVRDP